METNGLKVGGLVAAVGLVVLAAVVVSRSPQAPPHADDKREEGNAAQHRVPAAPKVGLLNLDRRSDPAVVGHLDADAKGRPRRTWQRKFRELPAQRDPQLEADPQFQKLLEMDSARKMALLEHDDPEALKRALADGLAKISRRVLEQALIDPNAEIRLAALFEISLEMEEPPLDLLAPVVEGDPDPEVRLEALEMVGEVENDEAELVIHGALGDPDEKVRDEAEDLLEERGSELP